MDRHDIKNFHTNMKTTLFSHYHDKNIEKRSEKTKISCFSQKLEARAHEKSLSSPHKYLESVIFTAKTCNMARSDGKTSRSINDAASAVKNRNGLARTDGKPSRSPFPSFTPSTSKPALYISWIEKEANTKISLHNVFVRNYAA